MTTNFRTDTWARRPGDRFGVPEPAPGARTPAPPAGPPLILLPTLNEEAGLAVTLEALARVPDFADGRVPDVLVVDGRSTDRTREVARSHAARTILQVGRGKGGAVREGLAWAVENGYGSIVVLDADGTYPCDRIPTTIGLLEGGADLVAGIRRPIQRSDVSGKVFVHRLGNGLLNACAAQLSGGPILDVCTGFWGVRASILPILDLRSNGFEVESELFVKSMRRGLRFVQIPVEYRPRVGEAKLHAVRDGARILLSILRHAATPRPSPEGPGAPRGVPSPGTPIRTPMLARDLSTLLCSLSSTSFVVLSGSARYPEAVEVARSVERCRPSVDIRTRLLPSSGTPTGQEDGHARPSPASDVIVVTLPEPEVPSVGAALVSVPRAGRTMRLETAEPVVSVRRRPGRHLQRILRGHRAPRPGALGILGAMLDASGFQKDVTIVAANASNGHLRLARVERGVVGRLGVRVLHRRERAFRRLTRFLGSP